MANDVKYPKNCGKTKRELIYDVLREAHILKRAADKRGHLICFVPGNKVIPGENAEDG